VSLASLDKIDLEHRANNAEIPILDTQVTGPTLLSPDL